VRVGEQIVLAKLPAERAFSTGEQATFTIPRRRLFLFDAVTEERVN
jgi:hypothetical protein